MREGSPAALAVTLNTQPMCKRGIHLAILISFDIDGTLEVGDPPGILTMAMVRRAQKRGF